MSTDTVTELPAEIEIAVETMLQLTEAQRLEICRRLEAGIDPSAVANAWSAEIAKRIQEIEDGVVAGIPSSQVRREIEELVGEKL